MPRETVYDQAGLFDVIVGWPDAHTVQVGVRCARADSIADALTTDGSSPADYDRLVATLDAAAIDRLIRVLHRARDAAFGID